MRSDQQSAILDAHQVQRVLGRKSEPLEGLQAAAGLTRPQDSSPRRKAAPAQHPQGRREQAEDQPYRGQLA
jgi:hypothetical protein